MPRYVIALAVGLVLLAGWVCAAEESHVRARLVADQVGPGLSRTGVVGVHFVMETGWHIYWKNPGDAGLATAVDFAMPDGFEVGELRWPAPIAFTQPGDLVAYGYEGSVVLSAEVTTPVTWSGEPRTFTASVSWLACKEVCVLGSAELKSEWPLAPSPDVFDDSGSRLPGPNGPFELSVTGGLGPGDRRGRVSLWLEWNEPPGEVQFFPGADNGLKITDARTQTRGRLTRIDFSASLIGGGEAVNHVPSVVTATDAGGGRTGWLLNAPLRAMNQ